MNKENTKRYHDDHDEFDHGKYIEAMRQTALTEQEKDEMARMLAAGVDQASVSALFSRQSNRTPSHVMRRGRRIAAAALAACLATGIIAGGATLTLRLAQVFQDQYEISEEDAERILASEPDLVHDTRTSVTDQDITVTALQTIADDYFVHIALSIQGLELGEGEDPAVEFTDISIGGKSVGNWDWAFYDGLAWEDGEDETPRYADGSPAELDEDGRLILRYMKEDGSVELDLTLDPTVADFEPGSFLGKEITLSIGEIGVGDELPNKRSVKGDWTLRWILAGSDTIRTCDLSEELGETGARIIQVRLSPISLEVRCDFPREMLTEQHEDQNGEPIIFHTYKTPPMPNGIRLKDGTVFTAIMNGGYDGYMGAWDDPSDTTYQVVYGLSLIVDPAQVESILFLKDGEVGAYVEKAPDLDDYYEVKLP